MKSIGSRRMLGIVVSEGCMQGREVIIRYGDGTEQTFPWLGLCDRITLKEKGKAAVRFRSGVEIEVEY